MPIIRRAAKTLPHRIRTSNDAALARYRRVMAQAPAPKRPVKVLMLHGFTQSGPSFHAKTRALEKNLTKAFPAGISLTYLTGPHRLAATDIPFPLPSQSADEPPQEIDAFAWWRARNTSPSSNPSSKDNLVYEGLEEGLSTIATALKEQGPFDGVIGFSQGACAAILVASLLEPNRASSFSSSSAPNSIPFPASFAPEALTHPPLKFAVAYSGFMARGAGDMYKAFYEPKVVTPTLHFIGTLDAVVEESRSLALAACCEGTEGKEGSGRVVYHPGGHFLPSSQKAYVGALIGFVKEVLHKAELEEKGGEEEESVEDMDMPF